MVRRQTVYFAYGSNLNLGQMSMRCPESRYLGRAILRDFRWLINTRGVANIASSPGDYVEGLCYLLSLKDEKRLDVNEGVPTAYVKETFPVEIFRTSPLIVGRRCREVSEYIHQHPAEAQQQGASRTSTSQTESPEQVQALVYINWDRTEKGQPRTEYINRIDLGITDALKLGVSPSFLEKYGWKPISARTTDTVNRSTAAGPSTRLQTPMVAAEEAETITAQNDHEDRLHSGIRIIHVETQWSNSQDIGIDVSHRSPFDSQDISPKAAPENQIEILEEEETFEGDGQEVVHNHSSQVGVE